MAKSKVGLTVESLGDYLKEQRVSARLSLRQLAEQAGVSNPYLSQIERGLRKPSADVLQQIAKALRISAEQLYLRAGILSPEDLQGRLRAVRGAGRAGRPRSLGAAEAVAAGRLRVVPRPERRRATRRTTSPDPHHPPNRRSFHGYPHPHPQDRHQERRALQTVAERPFYATVGVTDLAVEAVRDYVADVQTRVRRLRQGRPEERRVARPPAQGAARHRRLRRDRRVDALQGEVRTVPARVQNLVDDNVALVEGTYGDLVKRGESLVGRIRRQKSTQDTVKSAETTVAKAKTTKTQATKATEDHRQEGDHHRQEAQHRAAQQRQGHRRPRPRRPRRRPPRPSRTPPRRSATDPVPRDTRVETPGPPWSGGLVRPGPASDPIAYDARVNVFEIEGAITIGILVVLIAVKAFAFVSSLTVLQRGLHGRRQAHQAGLVRDPRARPGRAAAALHLAAEHPAPGVHDRRVRLPRRRPAGPERPDSALKRRPTSLAAVAAPMAEDWRYPRLKLNVVGNADGS